MNTCGNCENAKNRLLSVDKTLREQSVKIDRIEKSLAVNMYPSSDDEDDDNVSGVTVIDKNEEKPEGEGEENSWATSRSRSQRKNDNRKQKASLRRQEMQDMLSQIHKEDEEKKRLRCAVLINLGEDDGVGASRHLQEKVRRMCDRVEVERSHFQMAWRMGRFVPRKTRLVKVEFAHKASAETFLTRIGILLKKKDQEILQLGHNFRIRPSQSEEERKARQKVRELNQARKESENVSYSYRNGQIVRFYYNGKTWIREESSSFHRQPSTAHSPASSPLLERSPSSLGIPPAQGSALNLVNAAHGKGYGEDERSRSGSLSSQMSDSERKRKVSEVSGLSGNF